MQGYDIIAPAYSLHSLHSKHMDMYTEIVVKTLGATGYAGLPPGPELTQLLTHECAGAEKAAKLLENPKLAKLSPPLTPAQEMRVMIKNTITRMRELIIAEVKEEILLSVEMTRLCEGVATPTTCAQPPQPPPQPPVSPAVQPKLSRARPKIDAGGEDVKQSLVNNKMYASVTANLKRFAEGKDKTIEDFISERGGRLDADIAQSLRKTAAAMDSDTDSDDEYSDKWRAAEKNMRENLLG